MKKLIFFGVLGLFILASCNSTVTHTHNEHDHEAEGHNHATEDHDHSAHGDESGEGHSHETADSHLETAEAHSDEIILPKVKAEAAGVKASIIEPAPFQQVIKTSGQVLAAQGDESVAVATVAGVVSFRGKVTEGMSVGSGTPLVTISSNNIADGDPVQRARIAYEVSKKEYERMKALVKNKIVSDKEFAQAEQNYENARISYEALSKNHSAIGQNITAPIAGYVKSILVKEGDYVTIGQPLVSAVCSSAPKCRKSTTRTSAQSAPPISRLLIIIRYTNCKRSTANSCLSGNLPETILSTCLSPSSSITKVK